LPDAGTLVTKTAPLDRVGGPRGPGATAALTTVVVGLDFGTSSTKVVIRRRGDSLAKVVAFAPPTKGMPWFAVPSEMHIDAEGCVWFGADAARISGDQPIKWLKIELLDDPNVPPPRVSGLNGADARLLAAGFLAWVLGRVREILDFEFGAGVYRPLVQIGVPMMRSERAHEARRDRFLRMLGAAWHAAFEGPAPAIVQGTTWRELEELLRPQLGDRQPIPDRGTRLYDALPETLAALESIRDDPRVKFGYHSVVDIGAGTTDSLVVKHVRPEHAPGGRPYLIYEDESIRCGAADLETHGLDSRQRARNALDKHLRRTLRQAIERDGNNPVQRRTWSKMTVLLVGGGCREPTFRSLVESRGPWERVLPRENQQLQLVWHEPRADALDVLATAWARPAADRTDFFLLAIAHGLSKHRREWGMYFPPDDIEPTQRNDDPFEPLIDPDSW
jgi:hypothetical protein